MLDRKRNDQKLKELHLREKTLPKLGKKSSFAEILEVLVVTGEIIIRDALADYDDGKALSDVKKAAIKRYVDVARLNTGNEEYYLSNRIDCHAVLQRAEAIPGNYTQEELSLIYQINDEIKQSQR